MEQDRPPAVPSTPPGGRPSRVRYGVIALLGLAAGSAYLTRHAIAVANTTIQDELGIDDRRMGWVLGAFALGYFFCQIPGGLLGNRIGNRAALALISSLWSLLTVWTSTVTAYVPLAASRVVFGMAQAGLVPISARIINDWFPVARRGVCSSVIGASMSIGGVVAMGLTAWLMDYLDWRDIFRIYSLVGIVWAVAFYTYFRTRPEDHPCVNDAELDLIRDRARTAAVHKTSAHVDQPAAALSTARVVARMACNRTMWAINIQSFFRAAGYGLFVGWFPALLEYRYDVAKGDAGGMTMLPLAGVILGTLLGGVIVDSLLEWTGNKWTSRSGVALTALGICGLLTGLSGLAPSPGLFVMMMSLAALFSGLASPSAWAATMDVAGRYTAVVVGAMNMSGSIGGFVMTVALGYLIDDIRETGGDWNQVNYFVAVVYLAGSISWLAINPDDASTTQ